ncbi:hypothetical protein J1605_016055 [Eschrichtius robustus]|uniref:Uncharacterized protein n=1 Tax=Eschrichtius robustus TaxID=9764 RepID=A0AB34G8P5_ESCRO|nr:hypothetical protein J1605_016055 [Eschrichtius robustus]
MASGLVCPRAAPAQRTRLCPQSAVRMPGTSRPAPGALAPRVGPPLSYSAPTPPRTLRTQKPGYPEPRKAAARVFDFRTRPASPGGGSEPPRPGGEGPRRRLPAAIIPACTAAAGRAGRHPSAARHGLLPPASRPPPRVSGPRLARQPPQLAWWGEAEGRAQRALWRPPWERAEEPALEVSEQPREGGGGGGQRAAPGRRCALVFLPSRR